MVPRDARLAPSPLRAGLLLLVPLALMGTLLLGLLAQSATAEHGSVPGPSLIGPASPDDSTAPQWTFTRPADSTVTEPAVYDGSDTRTVTITHTYDTQCVYGSGPAGEAAFADAPGGCGVVFMAPSYRYSGSVSTDGSYVLSARTVERTTTSTQVVAADGSTSTQTAGPSVAYSAIESAVYVYDSTRPTVSVTGPAGAVYTGWTVQVDDATGVTTDCTLAGPGGTLMSVTCSPGVTVRPTLTTDGDYTLTVLATDAAGNSTTATSGVFTFDGTAPAVTFTRAPTGPSRATTVTWEWTAGEAGATTCSLSGPAGTATAACGPGSYTATLAGSGSYALTVVVRDAAGNAGTATSVDYLLDVDGPLLTVTPAGSTAGSADAVTWTLGLGDAVSVSCSLSTGQTPDCTGGSVTATRTTDGSVTLTVTALDALGNQSTATATYTRDTVVDLVVTAPAGPSSDRTPTWTFTAGEPVTVVSCALEADGQPVAAPAGSSCGPTGFTAGELPTTDGTSYVLVVRVADEVGNAADIRSVAYLLDTTAATLTLTPAAGQGSVDSSTTPSWTFAGDSWTSPTCVLTVTGSSTALGGSCTPTGFTAPVLTGASGTQYTLTVTVVDSAGNPTGATTTYTLDTVADFAAGTAPVSPGTDTTPTWTWTAETGSTVTCVLTSGSGTVVSSGACSTASSFTPSALPGTSGTTYTLTVTVVDAVGNRSTTTLPTYRLDTVSDVTPLTAPATPGRDTTPTWTWDAEDGATATCRLVDGDGRVVHDAACPTAESFTAAALTGTTGTNYVLTITVADALGNRTTTTWPAYRLDTVLQLSVAGPTGPSPDRTPRWSFGAEPLTTLVCTLTGPDGVVVTGGTCDQNGYSAPTLTADGDHVLTVRGVDAAGNDVTQTFAYDLDTLHLSIDGPSGPSPDRTPTWTFTDEPYVTARCVLTGPAGVVFDGPCTTTGSFTADTLPLTPGADYVLTVAVVDSIGNAGNLDSGRYRLDTQLPVASITVPASPSRAVSVTWTVVADEPLLSATCDLRRDGVVVLVLASCSGSTTVSLPGDGRYDLVVTVVDLAGNRSTSTSSVLVHDATVPVAPQVSPSSVTTNRTTASWTISAEGGTSVTTCRVLREGVVVADWATCGATFTLPLGADGSYVLEVVSTDPVGPGPTTRVTYLLDTVVPAAPALTGPTGPSPSRAPSWSISAEAGTSVECRLLRAGAVVLDWSSCAGAFAADLTGLPDGGYVLEARATDVAGNVSPVVSTPPYVLDTTAPPAPVVTGPSGPSQLRTPAFTWTAEAGARAECQLSRDGAVVGGWATCSSGFAPVLDRDGTWTLAVRLTDAAGNVGEPTTSGGYVLDTTAPPTPVVTPPQTPGRDLAPSWGVIVETGASLECRLSGPDGVTTAWVPCALPHATSLAGRPDGAYVLEVRATDVAGNLSPVGSGTYVLDTVAPVAAVISTPASPSRSRTPTFTFSAEAGASTRCRLTSGSTLISDFVPCSGSYSVDLTGLPDGTYTLTVRLSDAAGNPGPAATGTYVLDTTGPAAPVLVTSPATPSPARSATWAFSHEPGATLICRLTFPSGAVREIASCTSPLTADLTGLPDGTYTLTVRAVDAAGNVGGALTVTHVLDSTALAAPVVTGPVTPGSSRTPRWTFTGATAAECRLTRGTTVLADWTSCATQYVAALFGQPDGTYALSVRSTSGGQVSAAATSRYVLDTTGPGAATVVAPPTPSTNRRPAWTVASPELGATAECRVLYFGAVLRDWAPCRVTPEGAAFDQLDLTGANDGTYTLVVRLTDAAGNRGVEVGSGYVLDTSAPVGVGVTGPPSPGNDTTPTWTFTTAGDLVLECRLTSEAGVISDWDVCVGAFTADLNDQPDGVYFLSVRAVSDAGTPGPETTVPYTLSTAAPDGPTALVLSGTKPVDNDRSPTWTFSLPTGTTGRCTVTSGSRTLFTGACSSPFTVDLSNAADGSYTLTVWAVDVAGTDSLPVTSTYRLDVSAPASPTFTLEPGATGSTVTPQWRFTTVYGATAECRIRFGDILGDWGPCTSERHLDLDLTLRPDGVYVVEVRAVDDAGNSSAPRSSTYVLDRTAAPVASFTGTPDSPGTDRTVVWSFSAPEGFTLECRLVSPDGATGWASCGPTTAALRTTGSLVVGSTGRYALDLSNRRDGDYVLEVRLVDADGGRGSASRATYTLDTDPPDAPVFSDPPPAAGKDPRPTWSWDATSDDLVECRLLRNGVEVERWAACTSPYTAELTSQGSYRLEIRRVDAAGNRSSATGSDYLYDTTPPARPVLVGPPPSGSDRTVGWTFAMPSGVTATCTVTRGLNQVDARTCTGRYDLDLTGRPDGTYTLTVRFTDAAGNVGAPASGQYALRTVALAGRVVAPPATGPLAPAGPSGPGRGGTGVAPSRPQGSTSGPGVPTIPGDDDVPGNRAGRPSTFTPSAPGEEAAGDEEPGDRDAAGGAVLADPFPFQKVPDVLREAVTGTITRPTLPLALLAVVILFLLAQNRIDRRDPKLASAPVEAEPELDFTLIVRRPGGAFS